MLLLLFAAVAPAQKLLVDLAPGKPVSRTKGVQEMVAANNLAFYLGGAHPQTGLYVTDGTAQGTRHIWSTFGWGTGLVAVGHRVCWIEQDMDFRFAVWSSDGTAAGTRRLVGGLRTYCRRLPVATRSAAYFPFNGFLIETDGTPAGTRRVQHSWGCSVALIGRPEVLVLAQSVSGTPNHYRLHAIVGRGRNPVPIVDATAGKVLSIPGSLQKYGKDYYCLLEHTTGSGLFHLSTTTGRLQRVHAGSLLKSVFVRYASGAEYEPGTSMVVANNRLYFSAESAAHGVELWCSDGTANGTRLVVDLAPGTKSSYPHTFAECNGKLIFARVQSQWIAPQELWVSDGTALGTKRLSSAVVDPNLMLTVGKTVYFSGFGSTSGRELWRTDGTSTGTRLVKDIWSGFNNSIPMLYDFGSSRVPRQQRATAAVIGTRLVFPAWGGTVGSELWATDGTAAGTKPIRDVFFQFDHGVGWEKVRSGDHVWFQHRTKTWNVTELWSTDGATAKKVYSGAISSVVPLEDGRLLFTGGTGQGQVLVAAPGKSAVPFQPFASYAVRSESGRVYLAAVVPNRRTTISVTDGTIVGTKPILSITGGLGRVYTDGTRDYLVIGSSIAAVYVTDGTQTGTKRLTQAWRVASGAGVVYFDDPSRTPRHFKYDGASFAAAPEIPKMQLATDEFRGFVVGNKTVFVSRKGVWATDGTLAGTVKLTSTTPDRLVDPVTAGDRIYFWADDGTNGKELWVSDLTPQTTRMVKDVNPMGGQFGLPITRFGATKGVLFVANDGTRGDELFVTDGTAAGTRFLIDLMPGLMSGFAASARMVEVNKRLVFSGMSGPEGFEPHVLDLRKLMAPIAQTTGRGCAGSLQLTPRIDATAAPTVGNRNFGITLSQSVSNAPFVLGFAASRSPVKLGGCTLEIAPLITVGGRSTGTGTATVHTGVPNNPALLGQEALVQFAVGDRAGRWPGGIALSPALRIVVGR